MFTKFGLGVNSDAPVKSATAREVVEECEGSLRRLGVDQIDLFQLHWPVPQPIPETASGCAQLLAAGKIRAIGVSNFSVAQLEEWVATGVRCIRISRRTASCGRPRPRTSCRGAPRTTSAQSHIATLPRHVVRDMVDATRRFGPDDARGTHRITSGRFQRHLDAVDDSRRSRGRAV